MLFAKQGLGMEICQEGVRLAFVEGKPNVPKLTSWGAASFPADTVRFSFKEPNILNPPAFVAGIKETYLKLLTKTVRISVSLPDSVGRVMLLDLETRFKSKEEGADLIRWKLKKSFPFDINEAHLDYQVLLERDTGEVSALVSLISRQVLNQYEDLLVEVGLQPNRIDFTTFNLYRLFSERLEVAENAALIAYYGGVVSMLIFYGGILMFYRSKDIPAAKFDANRIYREINSSLLVYRDKYPGYSISEVFCVSSKADVEAFSSIVTEASGHEPVLLNMDRVISFDHDVTIDKSTLYSFTGALGAALRNF